MFKGIHNEAEFYTNFYFDNKLSSDLQSKVTTFADIKGKTDKLKGLESFYWAYRDAKPSNESLLEFYQKLLTVLGYQFDLKVVDTLKETSFNSIAQVQADDRTNLYVFLTNEIEEGSFETAPLSLNIAENPETRELSEVISEFFDELENPPKWILLGSPTTMFLLERNKWAFGKYIKFNWDEIFQQKTDDLFSSILGLISKESLCPTSGQSIHAEMDDNSHRHAFEVTTELRESVRESIELLINEMIFQKKEKHQAYMSKVDSTLYAKELTHDALFYAYRLIFLLFLEAQAEDSELLPLKSEIYRHGYSLEKLLELIHDIPDEKTADFEGTFVFESLQQIFSLIYIGFDYKVERDLLTDTAITNSGFLLKGIKSDLFSPEAVKHLKDIKLRNGVMLTVLRKLSLSSTGKGKNKRLTRVSYSNLGINQLGAVYEGLLSYSGFFAQEDLHALKPAGVKQSDLDNGKELDQIYLAPKSVVDKYTSPKEKKYKLGQENFVLDENGNPKIYKKGSFIYRLAGRDRQKLASYYTPDSLTKCTVKYSLIALIENIKTSDELWKLKILEPAMGSGAFLNEAVNQIAERILELENIPHRDKRKRLWEIKYNLISNNVYGLDLNPTAIELARFSLWLNCIGAGKEPPRFEGRLKLGNSLIGARFKKGPDGIYPWILLNDGMINYGKRLKDYDAEQMQALQAFRKDFLNSKLDCNHQKVTELQQSSEQLFKELLSNESAERKRIAYERLKLCADLWCSAFFLNENDLNSFPSNHEDLCDVFNSILAKGYISPGLKVLTEEKLRKERFFHWDIEFPDVMAGGGFDLILGNPPWVQIFWEEGAFVSDYDVIPSVLELKAPETRAYLNHLNDQDINQALVGECISVLGYIALLETEFYDLLRGIDKNTYKAFDVLSFSLLSKTGVVGLIQQDAILEGKADKRLREFLYKHYKYHFQFQNEFKLFSEVTNNKSFSINIFTSSFKDDVSFEHIGNLYTPQTIDSCFSHDSSGDLPYIKDKCGNWDTRGHKNRIVKITDDDLQVFAPLTPEPNSAFPIFLNLHATNLKDVIRAIGSAQTTFEKYLGSDFIATHDMFNETTAKNIFFEEKPKRPKKISEVILSGSHISLMNPYAKETRIPYTNKMSYDDIDLKCILPDYIPTTLYQPIVSEEQIDNIFPRIQGRPYRSHYRIITKHMVVYHTQRSFFTSIIPPGVSHINIHSSIATLTSIKVPICAGIAGSIIVETIFRFMKPSHFYPGDFRWLPIGNNDEYLNSIGRRALALNGLTQFYEDLWKACQSLADKKDQLITGRKLVGFGENFFVDNGLRNSEDRIQAMIELDALVALNFGLSEDHLSVLYNIIFSVQANEDRKIGLDRESKLKDAYRFFRERGW